MSNIIEMNNVKTADDLLKYVDDDDKKTTEPPPLTVSWMLNRHPLLGGDYYRAYRAAALASSRFGWVTSVADRMIASTGIEGAPEGKLGFVTPNRMMGMPDENARVFFPDVIVLRPVEKWTREFTDAAHEAGQVIIADVDDDLWRHEDLLDTGVELKNFSTYEEWFPYVDYVLCSTRYLADYVRSFDYPAPVVYAPNCFDPTTLNAEPKPSRRLGTRLWLSGRQDGDVEMYDNFVYPLLDKLDLSFTHIGAEPDGEAIPGQKARRSFGWDTPRLIERPSMTIPEMGAEFARFSIGAIMMTPDNLYNASKTDTHAVELASAGLPLVAASAHDLYKNIPGRVALTADAVERRVRELLDPETWYIESKRAKTWARQRSVTCETAYLAALLQAVNALTK
jgi:hypothetical protein